MRSTSLSLFACLLATTAVACDDDVKTGDPNDVTQTTCEASFATLQKDAYKETAGRSSELWPPHTTNTLTITCDGEVVREAVAANHGTQPGAKDAAGVVILQEMKTVALEGTRAELTALADAFEACSCEAETQFLSLDSLSETAAADLVGELTEYLAANLVCSDGVTTDEVLGYLTNGQIEETIIGLTYCSWASGATFEDGLDEALEAVIAATADTLADYHVCNNDAVLQADLVSTFVDTGKVTACDPAVATCRGPLWFYNP